MVIAYIVMDGAERLIKQTGAAILGLWKARNMLDFWSVEVTEESVSGYKRITSGSQTTTIYCLPDEEKTK